MTKERLHKNHPYVTVSSNVPNADSIIAKLTVPAGRVYKVADLTPLVLKLAKSDGAEISANSELYLGWQDPVSPEIHKIGGVFLYEIFRNISLSDQFNVETSGVRTIQFDSEEMARAARGEICAATGLTSDYKLVLVLKSADTVDWTQTNSTFSFEVTVLTEQEYEAEKRARA